MHDYVAILGKGAHIYTDASLYRDMLVQFRYHLLGDMVILRPTAFNRPTENRILQPTTAIPVGQPLLLATHIVRQARPQ